jgi:hypothetical protein
MKYKYKVGDKLIFRPLCINYTEDIYKSLYDAIISELNINETYVIREIWHKKGYRIYGKNNRGETPYEKIYHFNGLKVTKEEFKILNKGRDRASFSVIMFERFNLTIPHPVIDDNFINIREERKLKLEKIKEKYE